MGKAGHADKLHYVNDKISLDLLPAGVWYILGDIQEHRDTHDSCLRATVILVQCILPCITSQIDSLGFDSRCEWLMI